MLAGSVAARTVSTGHNLPNPKSYFLLFPTIPKRVEDHPRNPPKADLGLGWKENQISCVRRLRDCRLQIKIHRPVVQNYNPFVNA